MNNDITFNNEIYDEVDAALDIVLEEVDDVLDFLRQGITTVSQKGDFASVHRLANQATQVQVFQAKVRGLEEEWSNLFPDTEPIETVPSQPSAESRRQRKKRRKHLPRGMCTPEKDFYLPILLVLLKMGGQGQAEDVINQVGETMKQAFNEYDFQPLPSTPNDPRWRKTANRTRWHMVLEGLLASESPHGVWELTEAGKKYIGLPGTK